MSRFSIATPCPILAAQDNLYSRGLDDTTTTLNFTSALTSSLQGSKPKRKQRNSVSFAIHEDAGASEDVCKASDNTLLRLARRVTGTFTTSQSALKSSSLAAAPVFSAGSASSRLSQAPRRPPNRLSIVPESAIKEQREIPESSQPQECRPKAVRPVRRGTIYIPNEDTTMPSIFMGVFSPLKTFDSGTEQLKDPTTDLTGIAAQMAAKRGRSRRISMIDTAPRRAPLQASTRMLQEKAVAYDRPGQGDGKENRPPNAGKHEVQAQNSAPVKLYHPTASERTRVSQRRKSWRPRETSLYAPTASTAQKTITRSPPSHTAGQRNANNDQRKAWNSGPKTASTSASAPPTSLRHERKQVLRAIHASDTRPVRPDLKVPSRFVVPAIKTDPVKNIYDVLPENIVTPTLYEENWLGHQELALTQLINKIFMSSRPRRDDVGVSSTLTQQLLKAYDTDSIALLHNRAQAALLYGALSIPQDILDQGETWSKDIGRKQAFIRLWIDNYDRAALEAGLGVVTGRMCRSQVARSSSPASPSSLISKKVLFGFIESFLIRNEDASPPKECSKQAAWLYQRTILRSLMLIKALDMIKTCKLSKFASGLFVSSAPHKSSLAILQSLFQLMNPSAGDPVRALSYINYQVNYTQYPLEDYEYHIENLAVELRDGVRLTRLVELLLYPSASEFLKKNQDIDATTICLPAGDSIDFQNGQDWPLSQHLKFPCISRVARLWNVQIALSAVASVKDMASMVEGITAEDIVDGFREKTIRLLWALVGKCGLASLIDWEDVNWEIRRLRLDADPAVFVSPNYEDDAFDIDEDDFSNSPTHSFEACKALLKKWIRAVAAHKGISVHNFTTSFSDGRLFQCIVDTYEPFLTSSLSTTNTCVSSSNGNSNSNSNSNENLTTKLSNLGCSKQFADLFSPSFSSNTNNTNSQTKPEINQHHIFDRDFVLASLAFLCSRLLAPSKTNRAAVVIQRRWRTYWSRVEEERNITRKKVAEDCVDFVTRKQSGKGSCRDIMMLTSEGRKRIFSLEATRGPDGRVEDGVIRDEDRKKEKKSESVKSCQSPGVEDIWLSL